VIRVLIVDDRAVERAGLRRLLSVEPDFEVAGEAPDVQAAIFEARASKPDVILLDAKLAEDADGDPMGRLLGEAPETRVIVLSREDDPALVQRAFTAGASGYASKEAADAEVVAAVREVMAGGRYVNQTLGAQLVAAEASEQQRAEQDPLTGREREVLQLLALGYTNKEIAEQLHISVRTVESHRTRVMQKLSFGSRADLVRHALDTGLLTGSE
jgi:two-component system response regulator NreC